ncbi:MAG: hypothetical protein ACP5UO_04070 [Thermoplasmata archaeon]
MKTKDFLPLFVIVVLWNVPLMFPGVVLQKSSLIELLALESVFFSFIYMVSSRLRIFHRFLYILFLLSCAAAVLLIFSGEINEATFYFLAAIIAIRYSLAESSKEDFAISSTAFSILMLLLFLSTSLRILPTGREVLYIFSIYDNIPPAGVPITYAMGIVISIGRVTLTISPITSILFSLVAYLAAANTFLVIRTAPHNSSMVSAAVTALACQCENTIGILSATASYLVLAVLPYISLFSVAMLIATNRFLHNPRHMRGFRFTPGSSLFLFLALMAVESFLTFSGLILNLWVFGLSSLVTIFSGFFLGQIIPFRRKAPLASLVAAFAIQILLLFPQPIVMALSSPIFFEMYATLGIISGLLISMAMRNRIQVARTGIIELVFSMEAMISVAFLYLSLNSIPLFPGFTDLAVLFFSLFLLLISVPVMWFSNIFLLSARAFGA